MSIASTTSSMLRRSPGSVVVTFGALVTYGLLDHNQEAMDMGGGSLQVMGSAISVLICTGSLPGLKKGSAILVAPKETPSNTTPYKVREIQRRDDGDLSDAFLEVP